MGCCTRPNTVQVNRPPSCRAPPGQHTTHPLSAWSRRSERLWAARRIGRTVPSRGSAWRAVMGANGLAAEPRGAPSAVGARSCSPVGTGSKVTWGRARPGAVMQLWDGADDARGCPSAGARADMTWPPAPSAWPRQPPCRACSSAAASYPRQGHPGPYMQGFPACTWASCAAADPAAAPHQET